MRNGRAPAGFRPNGWPFGLQSRSRLGTFEPAKSMEWRGIGAGQPMRNSKAPQQDSSPMGGRLVCSADLVWAPLNPLKTWRVERYWRWATHATAEPLQDSGPMGGRLVCRADLVWAPLNPLKAWRVERSWRWATHAQQDSGPMGGRLVCRADLVGHL